MHCHVLVHSHQSSEYPAHEGGFAMTDTASMARRLGALAPAHEGLRGAPRGLVR
jgi:hypothetical protein